MAPSVQEGSVVVPAMTGASLQRPARQRLPIIPAIPRKLEKQLRKTSSLAAGSRSATNPTLEAPANHPAVRAHETQNPSAEPAPDIESDTQSIKHSEATDKPPLEELSTKDNTGSMASATGEDTAVATKMPPAVNFSSPSILDPESPAFVPDISKTPTETLDGTSSVDGHPSDPQVPSSMQTTAPGSWAPYESTSPDNSIRSPMQQAFAPYSQPPPLYYAPTVLPNDKHPNSSIYYGYDPSRNMSFYPRSSRSYVNASPVQSSYEGYAMANTPQAIHTRTMSSSQLHDRSTAENAQSLPVYTPSQYQPQHARPIPQFGNHFPITPSATPSNSGSQKQDPSPIDVIEHIVPVDQPSKADSKEDSASKTSQKYQEWCQQIMEKLQEESDRPAIPRALSNHLVTNFNNPTFADCELYISHVSHRFEPVVVSLHSLLIAQNSKLKALLQSAEIREDGKKQMLLNVKDDYADPAALKSAVRICYGERPSRYTGFPSELSSDQEVSKAWMNNALAFAAAGHVLEMTGVAHRGEQIASMVLDWDNLEQALSFAMDTTIRRAWGSSTSSSNFPCNASELLLSCLYFVISNIPGAIRLDLSAKPLSTVNRLPTASESEAPLSRSRLSRIQFGDLPVETEQPISKHDILTSAILFSLPFDHVKFILDRVPQHVNIEITKAVVQERERRRLRTLNAITSTNSADVQLHPSLTQEESIHEREGRLSLEWS
ncbi:MAG: hypothetical protein L6R38_004816 [Xanthoria sp. 2 TBL-2021]|nr:MAG: hypothetical protein L6R38_004816 [Xanthoria sp. 2 TBL-2021]